MCAGKQRQDTKQPYNKRVGEELPETFMPSQLYFHKTQLNSVSMDYMLFRDSYLFGVCVLVGMVCVYVCVCEKETLTVIETKRTAILKCQASYG